MRIQEMRSGILHLKKRMENDGHENYFETLTGSLDEAIEVLEPRAVDCELTAPKWSVVSFDKLEAAGLTYAKAAELSDELDARGVTGLCILTNEAASRMRR